MKKAILLILFSTVCISCIKDKPLPPHVNKEPIMMNGKCFLRLTTVVGDGTKGTDTEVLFQADQFRIYSYCIGRTSFKRWNCVFSLNGSEDGIPVKESVDQLAEQMAKCGKHSPEKSKDSYFGD